MTSRIMCWLTASLAVVERKLFVTLNVMSTLLQLPSPRG
jgi:hypothetical protein